MNKKIAKGLALILAMTMIFAANPVFNAQTGMTTEERRSNLRHDIPIEWISKDQGIVDPNIRVIVELKSGTNMKRVESQILAYEGAKIRNEYDVVFSGFSAEVPYLSLPLIYQIPGVAAVTKTTEYFETMATSKVLTQSLEAANEFANRGEGVVVAIVDSGIDVEHQALSRLDNPSLAKIQASDIKAFGGDNKDTKFNIKIPYGYNFADNSYYVKGLESNHGIHVAGIVGANDDDTRVERQEGIDGVASQVQLLAMKVFSNDPNGGGAHDDDIIAAIEASIEHQADIINLSLGTASGFMNPDNPMQRAINTAAAKGVLVVAAAGNEAAAFSESANSMQVQNFFGRQDTGLVGSPSTASGALSVASYENTNKFVYQLVFNPAQSLVPADAVHSQSIGSEADVTGEDVDGESNLDVNKSLTPVIKSDGESTDTESTATEPTLNQDSDTRLIYQYSQGIMPVGKLKFINVGKGADADYTETVKAQLNGNIALIERGDLTFVDKLNNAQANGAIGIVVYNNIPQEEFNMSLSGTDSDFFAAALTQENGLRIIAALDQNPDTAFEFDPQARSVVNDGKDQMSPFTSWGSTSSLDFKPEITGVGGQVYSTDNDNQYVMMSGTSMASPHVAGASAIILSQLKKDLPNTNDYVSFVKKTVMNTAKIIIPTDSDIPYSPRRQGSGLIQTKDAIRNRVLATMDSQDGAAAGELRSFSGSKDFQVYLHNYGTTPVSFRIDPSSVYTTHTVDNYLQETLSSATIKTDQTQVNLDAGEGKAINFSLDASTVTNEFVEGFIKFISVTDGQPNIHFAYMGFAGDWNQESIFDVPDVTENEGQTIYSDTQLISMVKNPLDIFDQGKIFPLGIPFGANNDNINPTAAKVAISPNGDGFADVVLPQIGMLRSAKHMEINILDSSKQVIRHLYELSGVRKQSYHTYLDRQRKQMSFLTYPYPEGLWDGTIYNNKTAANEVLPDGQYYMQVRARLAEAYDYQELLFPIKIDTVAPKIKLIQSEGQDYRLTESGRVITFQVTDDTAVGVVYAKVNGVRTEAENLGNDTYQVTIPYGTKVTEKLEIYANDTALNQSLKILSKVGGNSLRLTNWESYITTKQPWGLNINGNTDLAATATIAFEFVGKKDPNTVVTGRDSKVRNGRFSFVPVTLPPEGKYRAFAIEKDASGAVIKRTDLGDFIYDWHRPYLKVFKHAGVIRDKSEQKNPLNRKSSKYVEYIMQKNADGSATYEGKVFDKVFEPQELILTIGGRDNRVKINPDGTFRYVLKTPSEHFDFINVGQPTDLTSEDTVSSTIDGLDLATDPGAGNKKKRFETTYVVSKYLPYTGVVEPKEFKLTLSKTHVLGKASLDPKEINPVIERDGKYYFKIDGFTTQPDSKVFIAGEEAATNVTIDNGTHFSREVEIQEGANAINVRVLNGANQMMADVKVRVLFDLKLPSLELQKPAQDLLTEGKYQNAKQEEEPVLYVDTYEDELTFAGSISDAGFGYLLKINEEYVVDLGGNSNIPGNTDFGANRKEFSKVIKVEDQDIVTLYMEDSNGNKFTQKYIVRKLEKPVVKISNANAAGAVAGVNVNILNAEGEVVLTYVSETTPQNLALAPGTYIYQETATLDGLAKAMEVSFVVGKDGSLSLINAPEGFSIDDQGLKVVAQEAVNGDSDSDNSDNSDNSGNTDVDITDGSDNTDDSNSGNTGINDDINLPGTPFNPSITDSYQDKVQPTIKPTVKPLLKLGRKSGNKQNSQAKASGAKANLPAGATKPSNAELNQKSDNSGFQAPTDSAIAVTGNSDNTISSTTVSKEGAELNATSRESGQASTPTLVEKRGNQVLGIHSFPFKFIIGFPLLSMILGLFFILKSRRREEE